jgi:hypothetical protein
VTIAYTRLGLGINLVVDATGALTKTTPSSVLPRLDEGLGSGTAGSSAVYPAVQTPAGTPN